MLTTQQGQPALPGCQRSTSRKDLASTWNSKLLWGSQRWKRLAQLHTRLSFRSQVWLCKIDGARVTASEYPKACRMLFHLKKDLFFFFVSSSKPCFFQGSDCSFPTSPWLIQPEPLKFGVLENPWRQNGFAKVCDSTEITQNCGEYWKIFENTLR